MDELKELLEEHEIDYSETELVIVEGGIDGGHRDSSIEGLSDIFVSYLSAHYTTCACGLRSPPYKNIVRANEENEHTCTCGLLFSLTYKKIARANEEN